METIGVWGVILHSFIILCIAMVKGLSSEVDGRHN